jgi:hypothetical protein
MSDGEFEFVVVMQATTMPADLSREAQLGAMTTLSVLFVSQGQTQAVSSRARQADLTVSPDAQDVRSSLLLIVVGLVF